ncbi:ABC transporter ATP-binding protein [Microvenator marinus]|uniref:ABC transporter ATP-binding protein n=1 Tax=Microvenator marinus TaxID=2600177 RepID=A0A5B8Y072_9DELT|nr:ABC transporter ATP-binding protein [Microvenator marinus]QED29733.1 ABC transporter ATP-binding protein [Microvenator marinus]
MSRETISIQAVSKAFRTGFLRTKIDAVASVSFHVNEGEIFGVVGPNGAGKTTTIKMLTGILRPDRGNISVFGCSPKNRQARSIMGYLPENPYFYEHLRVEELLRFYGQLFGIERDILDQRIPKLVQIVGLEHARDRRLSRFSKGMRQRAGIAQALINDPKIVVLDEPQTGLDPFGRKDVRDLIFELKNQGKTVIFSSHILPDVEAVCDRVVLMVKGKVLDVGTLEELTGSQIKSYEVIATNVSVIPKSVDSHRNQGGATFMDLVSEDALQECLAELTESKARVNSVTSRRVDLEDVLIRDVQRESDQ